MTMPGFTAEASLPATAGGYRMFVTHNLSVTGEVVPQCYWVCGWWRDPWGRNRYQCVCVNPV